MGFEAEDDAPVTPRSWGQISPSEDDSALSNLELQQALARRQSTYEITLVRTLCRKWPTTVSFAGLNREVQQRTGGEGEVSLSLFLELNPDFPLQLGADKLWKVDRTSPVDWFERPTKTRPHRAWMRWYEELQSEGRDGHRPTVLAFPWQKLTSFMVVHDIGTCVSRPGRRMVYSAPHPVSKEALFVVEPLDQLIQFLLPETPRGRAHRKTGVRDRRAQHRAGTGDGPDDVVPGS